MIGHCRQIAISGFAGLLGLFPLVCGASAIQPEGIPVLVYHRFDPDKADPTTVRTAVFEAQLTWLAGHHYRVLPLHSVIDVLRDRHATIDSPAVAITVDDGHRSVYTEMFPLLQRYHTPVTLFIYPSAISNASYALTWEQIRTMQASGLVDVQSHTYWHPNFRKEHARLTAADYRAFVAFQLTRSKDILQKKLGGNVDTLAWPFGIYDPDLEAAASRAGYDAAFAYVGGPAHPGCDMFSIPRIPVTNWDRGARFAALLTEPQASGTRKQ